MSCSCTWKDLVKWVKPYLISPKDAYIEPPKGMIEAFVRRSAYDFAIRSGSLRKKAYYDINCGVVDYPIEVDETINDIIEVRVNGRKLERDEFYHEDEIIYLECKPTKDIEGGICIIYSYAPCTEENCDVPEDFCTHYREAIINGALSNLLAMPQMDWYSATESQRYSDMYEQSISRSKTSIRKRKGGRRGNICDIRTKFIQ